MNVQPIRTLFSVASAALLLGSGCVSMEAYERQQGAMEVERSLLEQENQRLASQLREMNRRIEMLEAESLRLQREQRETIQSESRASQDRLARVEQRVEEVNRLREQDKQQIVDSLSERIAQILRASAPASNSRRPAVSGYGREHVVAAGQTLSDIAKAYGVTVKTIADANNLSNLDVLRVGQKLFIPE